MKNVGAYKEILGSGNMSVRDHVSKTPIAAKADVLNYLKHGGDELATSPSAISDVLTGKEYPSLMMFTDGVYYWTSMHTHYFEEHNLELDSEFIYHVTHR